MRKKLIVSVFLAIAMFTGCETDVLNDNANLEEQTENNFPYTIDRVDIMDGEISIYLQHIGSVALHQFKLLWDEKKYTNQENEIKILLALADMSTDNIGNTTSYLKLMGSFWNEDSTQVIDSSSIQQSTFADSVVLYTDSTGYNPSDSTGYFPADSTLRS